MPGSYLADGGVTHAKTMLAYHRDAFRTARAIVVVFAFVAGIDGWMFVTTEGTPFAFGAGLSLAAVLVGGFLAHRHGKQVSRWTETLEKWEQVRRDRLIHARHLRGWEL